MTFDLKDCVSDLNLLHNEQMNIHVLSILLCLRHTELNNQERNDVTGREITYSQSPTTVPFFTQHILTVILTNK